MKDELETGQKIPENMVEPAAEAVQITPAPEIQGWVKTHHEHNDAKALESDLNQTGIKGVKIEGPTVPVAPKPATLKAIELQLQQKMQEINGPPSKPGKWRQFEELLISGRRRLAQKAA